MRISDWSSDVCSSDLDTRHNHAIDLATESEAMASRNARPTRETQWLPIAVVIAAGIIAALQVGKVSIGLPALRADLGMALGTAGWVMGVFALRSEEHTSEIQSLMRISYAVFCLKKKKQIHNKKHITH